jgi:SAM-dependent methyltransferase
MSEIDEIFKRYARRKWADQNLYSRFNFDVLYSAQERQRALVYLIKQCGTKELSNISVLEVGCGSGTNLLELIYLGAKPRNLIGNELQLDRMQSARALLPDSVQLILGDASSLSIEPSSYDFVYQSTVFSSILDNDLQSRLADSMWRWVKPGGGILWYDFIYNNPNNPDVKGVPLKRLRSLFPDGYLQFRRVTLAPPISRRVCKLNPVLYTVLNSIPFLRSHVFCLIRKRST